MELLVLGGALVGGFGLGLVGVLVARRMKRRDVVVAHEVQMESEEPADAPSPTPEEFEEVPFTFTPVPAGRPMQGPAAAPARPAPTRPAPPPAPAARPAPTPQPAPRAVPVPSPPTPRPPLKQPEPLQEIQNEWARRHVGPVQEGRMKGVCSGCGTVLSVSTHRPLRVTCSVCGRTRLLV